MKFVFNKTIEPKEIVKIRKSMHLTQKQLAEFLNVSEKTLRNWENSKEQIKSTAVPMLEILKYNPNLIEKYRIDEIQSGIRIKYMCDSNICAIIDVDYKNNNVKVKNYVDNPMYLPFGRNTNPTMEDFEEFLKSRCVSNERYDLKTFLEDIGVPFYDPMLIVEKTNGRLVEDNFWLKVERNNDRSN